jgi:RNA polymerase sigma-70 factor (ECF subfamily)
MLEGPRRDPEPSRRPDPADELPLNPLDSTGSLLVMARGGDERARDRLASRYLDVLRRWAHGRLPRSARDLVDTDDIVQSALYRAFTRIGDFENRGTGAFLGYIRQILLNQIRDEARRARRRPEHEPLPEDLRSEDTSPLEQLIGREKLSAYERSLAGLIPTQREAVMMRLELGLRYREIAEAMGLASGNAARMLVARGLVQMAKEAKDAE